MPNRLTEISSFRVQRPPRRNVGIETAINTSAAPITRNQATLAGAKSSNKRTAITAPQY